MTPDYRTHSSWIPSRIWVWRSVVTNCFNTLWSRYFSSWRRTVTILWDIRKNQLEDNKVEDCRISQRIDRLIGNCASLWCIDNLYSDNLQLFYDFYTELHYSECSGQIEEVYFRFETSANNIGVLCGIRCRMTRRIYSKMSAIHYCVVRYGGSNISTAYQCFCCIIGNLNSKLVSKLSHVD